MIDLLWKSDARCKGMDPEDRDRLFFPSKGRSSSESLGEVKKFCRGCPVVEECREYAMTHKDPGIWGGMTERERILARRKLRLETAAG